MNQTFQNTLLLSPVTHVLNTPISASLTYNWNFGSILGIILSLQIITGLLLVICFTNDANLAFHSVEYLIREIQNGWILRISHLNGASLFFICLYYHIGRGLFYASFRLWNVWSTGMLLYLIIIGEAFLGYVLLWGQISVWGAAVITSLVSVIPFIGTTLVIWVWGGFIVNSATLNCLLILHYLLPFIILGIVITHILFLHETGSTASASTLDSEFNIKFHPFYTLNDSLNLCFWLSFYCICLLAPFQLGDCENFNEANLISSPVHIQPEWYFLFIYAILRAIPNNLGGVIALLISIVIVWAFIFLPQNNQSNILSINSHSFSWLTVLVLLLTWLGSCPVEPPYVFLGQTLTALYFLATANMFLLWNLQW